MRNNKRRSGAYFGLHFDFHAGTYAKDIGAFTTAENIGKYLDEVQPDYVQIDTKGHPGYASYFTEYGDVAPGLTADYLKIIREETEKRGISLIAHHSSLWDEVACANHPEWAIVEADGTISDKFIDCTSDYTEKKFIFMMKELCGKYGFDGAWIDGDCWCVYENYRPEFVERFLKSSGYDHIDTENPESPSHLAFRKFCKDEYVKFVKRYISEIKNDYPNFEITSNTAFTSVYPEKPFDEVDFLSADVFDLKIRITARSFASGDKPWDIMSWGHPAKLKPDDMTHPNPGIGMYSCLNHLDNSCRIAASAISLGGGFQIIGIMDDQGEIMTYDIPIKKKLAEFMQARKKFNYNSVPLKNAAIWHSLENRDMVKTSGIVCDFDELDKGLCDIVIDCGRPVDIIFDYHIAEDKIAEHSTIILPEMKYISDAMKAKLLEYAKNGGNLIITGTNSCKRFGDVLEADVKNYSGRGIYAEQKGNKYYTAGILKAVVFEGYSGEELCTCFAEKVNRDLYPVKATAITRYGSGQIAFIGWDIISDYFTGHRFVFANIMKDVLERVDTQPNAYLKSGTNRVEIIPAEKDGMLLVNVINTTEYYYFSLETAYGEIPPVHDIEIAVLCDNPPKTVMLEPEHKKAQYTYDGKYAYVKIDKLDIHTIIALEF